MKIEKVKLAMHTFIRFLKDERGATAIEYGLIASLISVAILVALNDFGSATGVMYDQIEEAVVGAIKKNDK